MMLNPLSFNFKIFKEENKKFIYILALAILGFLFIDIIIPLLMYSKYLTKGTIEEININYISDFYVDKNILNSVLTVFIAILSGTSLFSYLHNKTKVDFYHSLPISRSELFFIKYFTGLILVLPIMIIAHIISYFIFLNLFDIYTIQFQDTFKYIMLNILFFISIYSFTVVSNILCGNSGIANILNIILLILNLIIVFILGGLAEIFLSPIIDINYLFVSQIKFSPLLETFRIGINNISIIEIIVHIFLAIIITILSFILFIFRKSENSSVPIAFKFAKSILKYFFVPLGAILMGIIFTVISNNVIMAYLGAILGAIILHCMVEIIYDLDFRAIFKNWYGIIICAGISVFIIFSYNIDLLNRETYVPKQNNVKEVTINFRPYFNLDSIKTENQNIIENIINLHKKDIEDKEDNSSYYNNFYINVFYKLKNGSVVGRNLIIKQEDINLFNDIINTDNIKQDMFSMLYLDDFPREYFKIHISNNIDKDIEIEELDKKNKIIEALKKDIIENDFFMDNSKDLFKIDLYFDDVENNDYRINNIFITENFKNTLKVLEEFDINLVPIKPEEIASFEILVDDKTYNIPVNNTTEQSLEFLLQNGQYIYNFFKPQECITLNYKNGKTLSYYLNMQSYQKLLELLKQINN